MEELIDAVRKQKDFLYKQCVIEPVFDTKEVKHAHFEVADEAKRAALRSERIERFCDVYFDTADLKLSRGNVWLRTRDKHIFAVKQIVNDKKNVMTYNEYSGNTRQLNLSAFSRVVLVCQITRCFINANVWVDFVVVDDSAGVVGYDCVGTIVGAAVPTGFGAARCGTALLGVKTFHPELFDLLKSSTDGTTAPCLPAAQPNEWPADCSSAALVSDEQELVHNGFVADLMAENEK